MAYRILGMAVWKGGKWFLRRKFGPTYVPRPVLFAAGLAFVGAVAAVVLSRKEGPGG
jgi:hypothetical protein